jgi:hypothetical protein
LGLLYEKIGDKIKAKYYFENYIKYEKRKTKKENINKAKQFLTN